jgi:hypothetical protein
VFSKQLQAIYFMVFFPLLLQAQVVVVSEYYNDADNRNEFTELLVTGDNVDLRDYTFRDNNSGTTSWQNEVTFTNIAFWNNMRRGTIIIIWHRLYSSATPTVARTLELQKEDGYIEVSAQSSTYFSISGTIGATFGSSPSWSGNSLNVAAGGDILQIRDASNVNVHALGHSSTMGSSWTGIAGTNKLALNSTIVSGNSVVVCPGASLTDYTGGTQGNVKVDEVSGNTKGLPNSCTSSSTANALYWRSIRQPDYPAPTLNSISANSAYNEFTLTWSACTDPNPSDGTVGYMILRNNINSFINPTDGTTYATEAIIGTAKVIALISSSSTTTYVDPTSLACGDNFYYKVYAFRYTTDNGNGNSFNMSRGRAYNENGTNVEFINAPGPGSNLITSY